MRLVRLDVRGCMRRPMFGFWLGKSDAITEHIGLAGAGGILPPRAAQVSSSGGRFFRRKVGRLAGSGQAKWSFVGRLSPSLLSDVGNTLRMGHWPWGFFAIPRFVS